MLQRSAQPAVRQALAHNPIVVITGPRQSGKTTLSRHSCDRPYCNLEAPDEREFALSDPRGFLARFPEGAIFDEVQHTPDLLSYLQVLVDADPTHGRFVLTGSHQLLLNAKVSQSLAGRAGLITLLPLSLAELEAGGVHRNHSEHILHGGYPRIVDRGLDPAAALGDYLATYVERDVRQLSEVRDLSAFRRFLRLCAGRTGQLLNTSHLARDAGVSHQTARNWISLLEASYIAFTVEPYLPNLRKRLTKSPKLYFHDVGLAAHLIGIETTQQLATHPLRGELFETLVVTEFLKAQCHAGRRPNLAFYRDSTGHEVDLVLESPEGLILGEAKVSATANQSQIRSMAKLESVLGETDPPTATKAKLLVYGGEQEYLRSGTRFVRPQNIESTLRSLGHPTPPPLHEPRE